LGFRLEIADAAEGEGEGKRERETREADAEEAIEEAEERRGGRGVRLHGGR
jgi:hypothetical protein